MLVSAGIPDEWASDVVSIGEANIGMLSVSDFGRGTLLHETMFMKTLPPSCWRQIVLKMWSNYAKQPEGQLNTDVHHDAYVVCYVVMPIVEQVMTAQDSAADTVFLNMNSIL